MYMYPASLTKDGSSLVVTFPDVPEVSTSGAGRADALKQGVEALSLAMSFYVEKNKPLPVPSEPKRGQVLIGVSSGTIPKLAIYEALREQDITQAELARRLGMHRHRIARIVDPAHNTRFEVLEAALAALGMRVRLSIDREVA